VAAALTGAPRAVVMSDIQPELVDMLREVLLDNHLHDPLALASTKASAAPSASAAPPCASPASAEVYAWGDESSALRARHFDVILGADCLYSHGTCGAFLDALEHLVRVGEGGSSTRVLICCEQRWSLRECLDICEARGWRLEARGEPTRPSGEEYGLVATAVKEQGGDGGLCTTYELIREAAPREQVGE
jgi:hypothetical protein